MASSEQKQNDDSSSSPNEQGTASDVREEEEERPLTVAQTMFYEAADFLKWSPPTPQAQTESRPTVAQNRPSGTLARDSNSTQGQTDFQEIVQSLKVFASPDRSGEIGDRSRRAGGSTENQIPASFLGTSPYDASTRRINTDREGNINRVVNPDGSIWLRKDNSGSENASWRVFNPEGKEVGDFAFKGTVTADRHGNLRVDQTYPVPQTYLQRTDGSYVHKYADGPTTVWDSGKSAKTVYFQDGNVQNIQFKKDEAGQPRLDHYTDRNNGTRTTLDSQGSFVTKTMDKPERARFTATATEYGVTKQPPITPPNVMRERVENAVAQTAPLMNPGTLRRPEINDQNVGRPVFLGPVATPIGKVQDPLGLRADLDKFKRNDGQTTGSSSVDRVADRMTDYARMMEAKREKGNQVKTEGTTTDGVPSPGLGAGSTYETTRKPGGMTWIGANRNNAEIVENGAKKNPGLSISDYVRDQVARDIHDSAIANDRGFRSGFGKVTITDGGPKTPGDGPESGRGLTPAQLAQLRAAFLNQDSNPPSWSRFIQDQRGMPFTVTNAPDQPPRVVIQPRRSDEPITRGGAGAQRVDGVVNLPGGDAVVVQRGKDNIAVQRGDTIVTQRGNDSAVTVRPDGTIVQRGEGAVTQRGTGAATQRTDGAITQRADDSTVRVDNIARPNIQPIVIPAGKGDSFVKGTTVADDFIKKQPEAIKNVPLPVYQWSDIVRTFAPPKNTDSAITSGSGSSNQTVQTFRPVLITEPNQPLSTARIALIATETAQLIQPRYTQVNRDGAGTAQPTNQRTEAQRTDAGTTTGATTRIQHTESGGAVVSTQNQRVDGITTQSQRAEAGGTTVQPRSPLADINGTTTQGQMRRPDGGIIQKPDAIITNRAEPVIAPQNFATIREQGAAGIISRGIDRDPKVFIEKPTQAPPAGFESTPIFITRKTFAELIAQNVVIKDQTARLPSDSVIKLTPEQVAQIRTTQIVKNFETNQPLTGGTSGSGTARIENQGPAPLPKPTRVDQQIAQPTVGAARIEQQQQFGTFANRAEQTQSTSTSRSQVTDGGIKNPIVSPTTRGSDGQITTSTQTRGGEGPSTITTQRTGDGQIATNTQPRGSEGLTSITTQRTSDQPISKLEQYIRTTLATPEPSPIWLGAKKLDVPPTPSTRTTDNGQAPAPPKITDQARVVNPPKNPDVTQQSVPQRTPQQIAGTSTDGQQRAGAVTQNTTESTPKPRAGTDSIPQTRIVVESTPQPKLVIESTPKPKAGVETAPQNTIRVTDVQSQTQKTPAIKNVELFPQQQITRTGTEVVPKPAPITQNTALTGQAAREVTTSTRGTSGSGQTTSDNIPQAGATRLTTQNTARTDGAQPPTNTRSTPESTQITGTRSTSLTGQPVPEITQATGTRSTSLTGQPAQEITQTTGTRNVAPPVRPAPEVTQNSQTRSTTTSGQSAPEIAQTTQPRTTTSTGQASSDASTTRITTGTRGTGQPAPEIMQPTDNRIINQQGSTTRNFSDPAPTPKPTDVKLQPGSAKNELPQSTTQRPATEIVPQNSVSRPTTDVQRQTNAPRPTTGDGQQQTVTSRQTTGGGQVGAPKNLDAPQSTPPPKNPSLTALSTGERTTDVVTQSSGPKNPTTIPHQTTGTRSEGPPRATAPPQLDQPSTPPTSLDKGNYTKFTPEAKTGSGASGLPNSGTGSSRETTAPTPVGRPQQPAGNPGEQNSQAPRLDKGYDAAKVPQLNQMTPPERTTNSARPEQTTTSGGGVVRSDSRTVSQPSDNKVLPPTTGGGKIREVTGTDQNSSVARQLPQGSQSTDRPTTVPGQKTTSIEQSGSGQPNRPTLVPNQTDRPAAAQTDRPVSLPTDRGPALTKGPTQTDRPITAQPERTIPTQSDRNLTTQAQRGLAAQPERTFPTQTGKELAVQPNRTIPAQADRTQTAQGLPQERGLAQRNPLADRATATADAQRALDSTRATAKTTDATTSLISRQLDVRGDIKEARITNGPQSGELKVPLLQGRVSDIAIVRPADRAVPTDRPTQTDKSLPTQKPDHVPLVQLDNRSSTLRGVQADQRAIDSKPTAPESGKQIDASKPADLTIKITRVPQEVHIASHQSNELSAVLNSLNGKRTQVSADEPGAARRTEVATNNTQLTGRVEVRVPDARTVRSEATGTPDIRPTRPEADTKVVPDAKTARVEPAATSNIQNAGTRFDTRVQPTSQPVSPQDAAAASAAARDGKGAVADPTRVVKSTFETGESTALTTPFRQQQNDAAMCGSRRFLTGLELAILIAAAGIVKIRPDRPYNPADATTEKQLKINQQVAFQLAVIKPIGRHVDESAGHSFRIKMQSARLDDLLQQSEKRGLNLDISRNLKGDQTNPAGKEDASKNLSLMEKALSAFATKFEEATNPFSINYKLEPMTVPYIAAPKAEFENEQKGKDKQVEEKEATDQQDKHGKQQTSHFDRPFWLIAPGETLVGIAEACFHDSNIGWLIADLNVKYVTERWENGKRVIECQSRQKIWLPYQEEIEEFYRQSHSIADPDNLITIVIESNVDQEIITSTLEIAMGLKQGRPILNQPTDASQAPPMLLTNKQQSLSERIQSTLGFLNPRPQMHKHEFLAELAGTAPFSPSLRYMQLTKARRATSADQPWYIESRQTRPE